MSISRIFTYLLITLFSAQSGNGLHSLTGSVEAGNYTYYILNVEGPILLQLKTLEGDADFYVSDTVEHPTFELDEHTMSSWTCGLDTIFVPSSFGRPINIGVYGHPRSSQSHYTLTADFLTDDEIDHFAQSLEDFNFEKPDSSEHSNHENYREPRNPKSKWMSNLGTMLYWLLEILVEILTAL